MTTLASPHAWKVETEGLSARASEGAAWVTIGNVSVSVIRFAATAIVARILVPNDFGLVGMGLLFIEMARPFAAVGFSEALIYHAELSEDDLATAFWSTAGMGLILTAAVATSAPLVASFFGEPRLKVVVPCLSIVFLLSGVGHIHAALLSRLFRFGVLAKLEVLAALARSSVMIVLALLGLGLWSIVGGLVLERGIKSLLLVRRVGWSPGAVFRLKSFRKLFRFGRNIYGHTILQYLSRNIDYLVVGRMLGPSSLAFYQFAFNIPHLVMTYVSESAERATFSLYSRLEEKEAVRAMYLKTMRLAGLLIFPPMFGLYFVADEAIAVLYGRQWSAAVPPLQILCFAAAISAVFTVNQSLMRAQGRPDLLFKWALVLFPVTAGLVIWGARYGIIGVAWAMLAASLANLPLVWAGLRIAGCPAVAYVKALAPGLAGGAMMLALLATAQGFLPMSALADLSRLIVNAAMGSLFVLGILYSFFPDDAKGLWRFARRRLVIRRAKSLRGGRVDTSRFQ